MISDILWDHGLGKGLKAADKQALIDIHNAADTNQSIVKTDIVNALKAKGIGASLSASSAWNDIRAAIEASNLKRWASGVIPMQSASQTNTYRISAAGLAFRPATIIITAVTYTNPGDIDIIGVYNANSLLDPYVNGKYMGEGNNTSGLYNDMSVSITNTSWAASVFATTRTDRQYYWIAFE
ncbi:hypothetical protein [Brevibacillus agri]|uniref:hypothetical protein n=1 Tax=Brevibacillus agri TaxID=51101 RepID=UPI003D704AE6